MLVGTISRLSCNGLREINTVRSYFVPSSIKTVSWIPFVSFFSFAVFTYVCNFILKFHIIYTIHKAPKIGEYPYRFGEHVRSTENSLLCPSSSNLLLWNGDQLSLPTPTGNRRNGIYVCMLYPDTVYMIKINSSHSYFNGVKIKTKMPKQIH